MGVIRHATYECDRCKRAESGSPSDNKHGALAAFGIWRWRKVGFTYWPHFDMNRFKESFLCAACSTQFRAFMANKRADPTVSAPERGEQ